MIATINRTRILNSLSYKPDHKPTGVINGIKWVFLLKKQLSDTLFRYEFRIRVQNRRGRWMMTSRTIITGDEDIRTVADIAVIDNYPCPA